MLLDQLIDGPLFWFAEWPSGNVPVAGSLVYTIWNRQGEFVYVGMAGRSATPAKGKGPFGRLASHASGRRGGDQFCIYVCDRIVLPRTHNRISEIAAGTLSLDVLTREYIRAELGFRFQIASDPVEAFAIERLLQRGESKVGRPFLNPVGLAALDVTAL